MSLWCFWGIAFMHIWFDRTASKADSLCTDTDSRLLRQTFWSLSRTSFTLVQSHHYQPFCSGSTLAAQTCVSPGPKVSLWKPWEREKIAKSGGKDQFFIWPSESWLPCGMWYLFPLLAPSPTMPLTSEVTCHWKMKLWINREDPVVSLISGFCLKSPGGVLNYSSTGALCELHVSVTCPPLPARLWVKAVSLGTLSEIADSGSRNEIKEEIGCISIRGVSLELNTHITQKHHWLPLSVASDHHFFIHTGTHAPHTCTHTPLFNSIQPIPLFQLTRGNTRNKVRRHEFPEAVSNTPKFS